MRFDDAFKIVLGFEGGYVNNPADRGALQLSQFLIPQHLQYNTYVKLDL